MFPFFFDNHAMRKNQVKSYPVALLANVLYNGQPMSRKDVIDDVVLRRKLINFKKQTTGVRKPYIVEDPSTGERFRFDSMAEKKYIDTLLKRISNGAKVEMEHISTIQKIKTENPSNAKAAEFIAADHIEEKVDYYDELKKVELDKGGKIKTDKNGNYIGDGKYHVDFNVIDFSEYPQIKTSVSKSNTTESVYVTYRNNDNLESVTARFSNHENNAVKFGYELNGYLTNKNEILYRLGFKKRVFVPNKKKFIYSRMVAYKDLDKYQEADITIKEMYDLGENASLKEYKGKLAKDSNYLILGDEVEVHFDDRYGEYIYTDVNKLEHGGPIQKLDKGTVLEGPSHENGGIQVVVNNKPVAEAEGGEVVINAENSKKYCEELSEINQRHGNGRPLNCDEDDRSEFMRQGGKVADVCPAMEQGGKIELPLADLEEETMARGGLINKRMKFPKTYKPQPGKYGSGKKEPEISDYQKNKFIEKMIDEKGVDPNSYTFEEKQYLRQYSGYGGIDVEEFSSVEEAKKAMTEFYTPDTIIRKMWALAYKYGFKDGQSVLEPSVGTGEFLKYVPVQSMATGYEINKYSYSICKILYPQFDFYLQPFENVFIKNRDTIKNKLSDVKKFDLVIGNPPYGEVSGLGMGMGEKQYTNAKNWIEYFILRGLDLTLPNGLLIYIIGTEVANGGIPFLQQGTSKIKEAIAQKADLLDAYRLPNGVFDRTDVLSDILVFKRK